MLEKCVGVVYRVGDPALSQLGCELSNQNQNQKVNV